MNRDGCADLYLTDGEGPTDPHGPLSADALHANQGDGTFVDVTAYLDPVTVKKPGFSAKLADYDNDGDLDFYYSSVSEMILLQNQASQGSPVFVEVSEAAGVTFTGPGIGWGTVFLDYDNDSNLDLYLATMNEDPEYANRLFRNLGDGTFEDVSADSGASQPGPTLGVAAADFQRDGGIDLVIGNMGEQYFLFENTGAAGASNHRLDVRLEGRDPIARDAVGSRVYLRTSDGRTQMRWVSAGSGMGSGDERTLHFGLGHLGIEELRVVWPDGVERVIEEVPVDGMVEVVYGEIFRDGFEAGDSSGWSLGLPGE